MGYSELYCHLCGVSFNIIFRLKSGDLDMTGPQYISQWDEADTVSSTYTDDAAEDPDYQSHKDYVDNEPFEYDSDYEWADDTSVGENAHDNEDNEDNADSDIGAKNNPEDQMYYKWVLQTFDPRSATRGEPEIRVGYFDSQMSGYSADAISPEEARGCRTAQFLMHKTSPKDQWQADQLHEPWEIDADWYLSGICDGTPSRDIGIPKVWPSRNGIEDVMADNVNFGGPGVTPDDVAMPFHPWCFDIFCRQSKVQFGLVNVPGLMAWRNSEFSWDAFASFPRAKEVKNSQQQWWSHEPGTEYLVTNPLDVPRLPEILLAAVKHDGLYALCDPYYDIEMPQSAANRSTPSHNSHADFFSSLPVEIRLLITDYLGSRDIFSLGIASKPFSELPNSVWYRLVRREMPWLWEAWDEPEYIHNPSPWTNVTTADIKSVIRARSIYIRALCEDFHTEHAAERIAECRFPLGMTMPDQVRLPKLNTDWRRVFMQIQLHWDGLKGLRNRQRIWVDVEEIVRRIRRLDT